MNLFNYSEQQMNKFKYKWQLSCGYPQSKDGSVMKNNYNVFGIFLSGGGSSMGYKLAGFNHLGGVEYNPKIAKMYKENHNPKYLFVEDIRLFNKRDDLPQELYELDILDGSPPCTTFSICGLREKSYGVKKKFAEGGREQTLDDLVFVYADTINKLKPKTFIFENVKGFTMKYAKKYYSGFSNAVVNNYILFDFILNSADMGLPQARERCFIIGARKDLGIEFLSLNYNEIHIPFKNICDHNDKNCNLTKQSTLKWYVTKEGHPISNFRSAIKVYKNKPCATISNRDGLYNPYYPRYINTKERCLASSIPLDYKFLDKGSMLFFTGMCVPPLMIANISLQIKEQILDKAS